MERGYILQEDTKRVVIATMKSANIKTGDMVQVFILNKDLDPVATKKEGKDAIICGSCPLKSGNGCYVNVGQAPLAVYRSYKRGIYSRDYSEFLRVVENRFVRFGAYGDPSYIKIDIIKDIVAACQGHTGYSHQWMNRNFNGEYLNYLQASIDNENQLKLLNAKFPNAKYFRIVDTIADKKENETICLNETTGASCLECGLCNGTSDNFIVIKHGTQKNKVITK